jgi:hypothetical protein
LFDDYAHHGIADWKKAWREFLRLGNLLQFIIRFDFVSSLGLADDIYHSIFDWERSAKGTASTDGAVPNRLIVLLELVDAAVRDLCRIIAERGKTLPEAGFELTSPEGEIIATAELAWPASKIALLLEHEAQGSGRFEAEGWRIYASDLVLSAPELLLDVLPNEVAE